MNRSTILILLWIISIVLIILSLILLNAILFNAGSGLLLLLLTISLAKLFR